MNSATTTMQQRQWARQVRERFVEAACEQLPMVGEGVRGFLTALLDQTGNARQMQDNRDAWDAYRQHGKQWLDRTAAAWRGALAPTSTARGRIGGNTGQFELLGDDVMENKILASRMALVVADKAGTEFDDLRVRIQELEGQDMASYDVLRPDVVLLLMLEQWIDAGLSRQALQSVFGTLQGLMADVLQQIGHAANAWLIAQGVLPRIDFSNRVRRSASTASAPLSTAAAALASQRGPLTGPSHFSTTQDGLHSGMGGMPQAMPGGGGGAPALGAGAMARAGGATDVVGAAIALAAQTVQAGWLPAAGSGGDTRGYAMSAALPLTRARQRAQGVIVQLKRLLAERVSDFEATRSSPASEALALALAPRRTRTDHYPSGGGTLIEPHTASAAVAVDVGRVAVQVREQSAELKKKASTDSEKAIIEIVALMFQSILTEERIPPAVRVWFARLQVPVLRVALAEPEFFNSLDHPARQLIDRMGSCVLGFDANAMNGNALEAEIRRVVQVIEQYPETGRRVFQLVYTEFQKFLAKFLTEKKGTSRLVSVAQQVEQKETLTIQYTIELRNMLKDMPVPGEVRDFLFKTWAEVLAISAVRRGPQHADTLQLKRAASDLVWAASAKPNRSDRARVIQDLPQLLQHLRQGLLLLGISGPPQDAHIKILSDTLADAFMSKTAAIPQERIEAMARRLANLEEFMGDEAGGSIPLDADSIGLMLDMDDTANLQVIADNGAPVDDTLLAWVLELQPGTWFSLDHNGHVTQVQYAWRSDRRQLHLFASLNGGSYLFQLRRLAAYLQAGLLVPQEEESLTLRATRDALAKLDANPERLLG
ncbi:DUF1631 family protein [Ramlibacter sp. H39-3-26]|uniref:DUF1631 family protein n=1 Tax=Curvibacter soli TaxID=3031331 RepID=UPI0023DCB4D9|nr:DUF1631 family protein [Ramlibacter sp. H39-3-26]MDF1484623.1 DUF1631 family protein [Ramlibacter sp. H39-3-26]